MDRYFLGYPRQQSSGINKRSSFTNRDISKELLHAQTHKPGVNNHPVHKFPVFSLHGEVPQTSRGETPELLEALGRFLYKKDPNSIQTLWQLPTQPEVWE